MEFFKYFLFFSKPDADSSTDKPARIENNDTSQCEGSKDIVNYPNDSSLSITSVQSNNQQQSTSNILQISSPNSLTSASKISLVPTKLLLKSQAGFSSTTSTATITTNAQSSIPMKVVFVNALNNNPNAQQAATVHKQQQITLNKTLAQQLQNPTPNSTFITNKIIGQAQPTKTVHLVNKMPSPNFSAAPATSISNMSNTSTKLSAATSSNGHHHRHDSSSSSSSVNRKSGKSSKSLLGSNKLPGKN